LNNRTSRRYDGGGIGVIMGFFALIRKIFSAIARILGIRPKGAARALAGPGIASYVNRIVSDAILFNEIPSPTEAEAQRTAFILQRLADFGYADPETDGRGNVSVIIPAGDASDTEVLVFSDIRNESYSPLGSLVRLDGDLAVGMGIAENSIGVAALLVLAEYAAKNEIRFGGNITLLFSAFDPGARDVQPLELFLSSRKRIPDFALNVRGLELGRIAERPLGTYKITALVRTPERAVDAREPGASTITVLANVANRLGGIRWDGEAATFLNVARIEAGAGYGWYASEGTLEIEVFSPDAHALEVAKNAVCATITNLAEEKGASAELSVKAYIPPANAEINAGLNAILKSVHERLKLKSKPTPLPDHAAFLNSLNIPAVSIGMTTGRKGSGEEYVDIRHIETGFRQLIAFLERSTQRAGRPQA
jgi:tripeptide aminopeptidase